MKKRIIFVDDEQNVLDGLKRMLHARFKPDEWDLAFVASGGEALTLMEKQSFDVIVTDMRMPHMDGVALLSAVTVRFPQTVRFVLSGHSDRELILQTMGFAHQYLAKPCDANVLINAIGRAFTLRNILSKEGIKKIVAQIKSLPALPALFVQVLTELKSPDASAQKVGEIIGHDVAMSAKVLQLVNSAFFGISRKVESPTHAVTLLGLDVVKSLVLMVQVFSQTKTPTASGFSMDRLWRHSLLVAQCAQTIMGRSGTDKKAADDAFMAGLLHDIGKLIIATNMPDAYRQIISLMEKDHIDLLDAERKTLEVTHGEIGGYLMGLWGFPDPVIEACIFHCRPHESSSDHFTSLVAVHVANVMVNRFYPDALLPPTRDVDMEFLSRLKIEGHLAEWEAICGRICGAAEKMI